MPKESAPTGPWYAWLPSSGRSRHTGSGCTQNRETRPNPVVPPSSIGRPGWSRYTSRARWRPQPPVATASGGPSARRVVRATCGLLIARCDGAACFPLASRRRAPQYIRVSAMKVEPLRSCTRSHYGDRHVNHQLMTGSDPARWRLARVAAAPSPYLPRTNRMPATAWTHLPPRYVPQGMSKHPR